MTKPTPFKRIEDVTPPSERIGVFAKLRAPQFINPLDTYDYITNCYAADHAFATRLREEGLIDYDEYMDMTGNAAMLRSRRIEKWTSSVGSSSESRSTSVSASSSEKNSNTPDSAEN